MVLRKIVYVLYIIVLTLHLNLVLKYNEYRNNRVFNQWLKQVGLLTNGNVLIKNIFLLMKKKDKRGDFEKILIKNIYIIFIFILINIVLLYIEFIDINKIAHTKDIELILTPKVVTKTCIIVWCVLVIKLFLNSIRNVLFYGRADIYINKLIHYLINTLNIIILIFSDKFINEKSISCLIIYIYVIFNKKITEKELCLWNKFSETVEKIRNNKNKFLKQIPINYEYYSKNFNEFIIGVILMFKVVLPLLKIDLGEFWNEISIGMAIVSLLKENSGDVN